MQMLTGCHTRKDAFGVPIQQIISFAPGRVNLIGEHTDYNGGMVMPAALPLGIQSRLSVMLSANPGIQVASSSSAETIYFGEDEITSIAASVMESGVERSERVDVPELPSTCWASYVVGCFVLCEATLRSRGIVQMPWSGRSLAITLESSLPQGAGLSSSAALCVSIIGQLSVLAGAPFDASTIARLAMYVEHRFAGTKCGLMDQVAVLCSRPEQFTCIDFVEFPISGQFQIQNTKTHRSFRDFHLCILNTGVSHSLAESAYNERRSSCHQALLLLNTALDHDAHSLGELARFPQFQSITSDEGYLEYLQSLLPPTEVGGILARRACHAMRENARVVTAAQALLSGDTRALDAAMRASHRSLDMLYEVTCPELNLACRSMEEVVGDLCAREGSNSDEFLIGPRMTGGGFGGSTIQLVHKAICDRLVEQFSSSDNPYTRATGIVPEIVIAQPSSGFSVGFEAV